MKFFWIIGLFFLSHIEAGNSQTLRRENTLSEENKVIILSIPRSGVNMFSCSLLAITKRPVGRYPNSIQPYSSGRLDIDWISTKPFGYRTHKYIDVTEGSPGFDKLIFIVRSFKELIFREFDIIDIKDFHNKEVQNYIENYIKCFEAYDSWPVNKRLLVFYEDMCVDLVHVLSKAIHFINPSTQIFMEDFMYHQEEYLSAIRSSYIAQHQKHHGKSSSKGRKAVYYTQNQKAYLLKYLDSIVERENSTIWEKYLKRFATE